jgi:hypothetical protein
MSHFDSDERVVLIIAERSEGSDSLQGGTR